jgi:hypothetical protein
MRRVFVLFGMASISGCGLVLGLSDHELASTNGADAASDATQSQEAQSPVDATMATDALDALDALDATDATDALDAIAIPDVTLDVIDAAHADAPSPVDAASEADAAPVAHVVATGQDQPFSIALTTTSVVWVNNDGTIYQAPKAGGAPAHVTTVTDTGFGKVNSNIVADDRNVYWRLDVPQTIDGVRCCAKSASLTSDAGAQACAAPCGSPYSPWAGDYIGLANGALYYATINGSSQVVFAYTTGDAGFNIVNANFQNGGPIAVNAHRFVTVANALVVELELATMGGGEVYAGTSITDVGVDDTRIFFIDQAPDAGTVYSSSPTVGPGSYFALATLGQPAHLAVDANYVYVTDPVSREVDALAKADGAKTVIAHAQMQPDAIAVDATGVYWSNVGDSTIQFAPLPP